MFKTLKKRLYLLPIIVLFIGYLLWLFRAYYDVAYMDQIQFLAGNLNHLYNHDATIQDFYYRSPFLSLLTVITFFLNCKLFSYNTYYETIGSAVSLLLIAIYYFKTNASFFNNRYKLYLSAIVGVIVFCFVKWEMSLWGGGVVHYLVILLGLTGLDSAHRHYFRKQPVRFIDKNFGMLFILASLICILESTSYFLPFLVSLLILLAVNYKLFRGQIDIRRWRLVFGATVGLIAFTFLINYLAEQYSFRHSYEPYGKVNMSQNIGGSLNKVITDPLFVIKFYFNSIGGNLIDRDSYKADSFAKDILPYVGLIVLMFYCYAFYLFFKSKRKEGVLAVNLILYTVLLCGAIMVGRMSFNDVYFGTSSRYSSATFMGLLGLSTFFLLLLNQRQPTGITKKILFAFPILLIMVCSVLINKNQWQIAPYRKYYYMKMAESLKANKDLELLMGYNNEITGKAREMMIRNKLNVFKPKTKLENYTVTSGVPDQDLSGFYNVESSSNASYRWTDGKGTIFLPNLYTIKDTIKVKLACYIPIADTPIVILNDRLMPFKATAVDGGFEYSYAFQEQKVLFKALIHNKSFRPQEINKNSSDLRTLGLIFHSLTLQN